MGHVIVIKHIADMIVRGMTVEEIHNHSSLDIQDESTFFLLYKAAEIIANDRIQFAAAAAKSSS